MKRLFFLLILLIEIISSQKSEKTKRKLADNPEDYIVILHTNDVHCGLQDYIGYDGLMLYKRILEKQGYKDIILADAGDHIQGGIYGLITKGQAIVKIMNYMNYSVATLGNHEFDYGVEELEKVEAELNCKYISINYCYRRNKTAIYPAYKIVESNGKKIAFIGVATPQTLSKTGLITQYDNSGNLIYYFLTDNQSRELYQRVQSVIDKVKSEEKADYVIILGHLGYGGDALEENTSIGLLRNIKGITAVIDGHTHLVYDDKFPDKSGNNILIAQTGTKLEHIGVVKINIQTGAVTHEMLDSVPNPQGLSGETLDETYLYAEKRGMYVDKKLFDLINEITSQYKGELNKVVGHTNFLLNVFNVSLAGVTDRSTQVSRSEENPLCNLVTDAIKYYGEAEITIMNAGSVRVDLNAGDITFQDIINMMPFSNDILVKEITGQTILDALEHGARILPGKTSTFPQVSGITYKIDMSIPSSVILDSSESFVRVGGKRRVYDVKVNGKKLKLLKTYIIASNSFILNGGDGYSMFTDFEVLKTSSGVDNEVALRYIQEYLGGEIPIKYNTTEGRIIKTEGRIYSPEDENDGIFTKYNIILALLLVMILL